MSMMIFGGIKDYPENRTANRFLSLLTLSIGPGVDRKQKIKIRSVNEMASGDTTTVTRNYLDWVNTY